MVRNLCPIPFDAPTGLTKYDSYRRMLGLSPVLSMRVAQLLAEGPKWGATLEQIDSLTLPDNDDLPPERFVELTVTHVRHVLKNLREILGAQPVVFVRDGCFTNDLLRSVLVGIAGSEDAYANLIREVHIDYSNPPPDAVLREYFPGKRIVIIGGSESDTDTIHPDMYSNHLAKCVRESFSGPESSEYCHRFLAICFGSQYAANLIGAECGDSLCVPATMRGPAQFGPSPCRVSNLRSQHEHVQSLFSGLSFNRGGGRVSLQFTRTGYVEPNFFSSKGEPYLIPVVTDEVTGGVVGWADRRNHRVFGMQAHPEIPLNPNSDVVRLGVASHVNRILHALKGGYGDEVLKLEDQFFPDFPIRDPGEAFYSQALSTLADDLLDSVRPNMFSDYAETQRQDMDFQSTVSAFQGHLSLQSSMLSGSGRISVTLRQVEYLSAVDSVGKVELLCHADWKVGRGAESYGEVCWVDMIRLVEAQRHFLARALKKSDFLTFNDFGAGNGTFLSEMRKRFETNETAFFYGVGDRVYFDLYQGISQKCPDIPERVRMAFVQEVIRRYVLVPPTVESTLMAKFGEIFKDFYIDVNVPIDFSSMFSSGTVMFSGESEIRLEEAEKIWIRRDPGRKIATLVADLVDNPYFFIEGSFDRIAIADFRDYEPPEGAVPKEDLRVSVRGTSHLDAGDLSTVLDRFAAKEAAPGSVFVDNGVHRSYTSVPRLKEYLNLQSRYPDKIRVMMAYDRDTNYFCSALVEKAPFHDASFYKHVFLPERPGPNGTRFQSIVPVSIVEAEAHPFFRFERFFRDFLVSNFRSYEIFWFFNADIVSFLGDAVHLLAQGHSEEIRSRFVHLVERFCLQLNERAMGDMTAEPDILYVPITDDDLSSWTSKDGDTMDSVLKTPYFPTDWFNADAKRRY